MMWGIKNPVTSWIEDQIKDVKDDVIGEAKNTANDVKPDIDIPDIKIPDIKIPEIKIPDFPKPPGFPEIPTEYLLIGGAILAFMVLKK